MYLVVSLDYNEAVKYAFKKLEDHNKIAIRIRGLDKYNSFSPFLFSVLTFGISGGVGRDIQWSLEHLDVMSDMPFLTETWDYLDEDLSGNLFGCGAGLDALLMSFFDYIDKSGIETSYTFIKEYYKKHGIPQEFASFWVTEDNSFAGFDVEIANMYNTWGLDENNCYPGCDSINMYVNLLVSSIALVRVGSNTILYTSSYFMLKKLKDADLLINSSAVDSTLKLLSSLRFIESCFIPIDLEKTMNSFRNIEGSSDLPCSDLLYSPKIPIIKLVPTIIDEQLKFKVILSRDFYSNYKHSSINYCSFYEFEHAWRHFKAIFTKYPMRVTLKNGREFVVTYNSEILNLRGIMLLH